MKNLLQHQPILDPNQDMVAGILAGTSIHLWYLPYIFTALVVFGAIKQKLSLTALALAASAVALLLILAIPVWRPLSLNSGYPWAQWAHATTPLFLGILLGCAVRARWAWLLLAMIVVALFGACVRPYPDVGLIYLLGFVLVAAVMAIPSSVKIKLPEGKYIFGSTLGVYLVHPLALYIVRPIIHRNEFLGIVLAFTISLVGVLLARYLAPWPSNLILGTPMNPGEAKSLFRRKIVT